MKTKNKNKYHNPVIFGAHTSPSVILSGCEGSMDSSANAFRMTTEGGRSMVEMLGVLAIIGVLSVGGIAGYTMAMNKYKANEIVNAVSMTYMLGMSANKGQGDNLSYGSVGTMPTGASSIDFAVSDKTVVAKISDKGVCDQVANQLGDKVTAGDCEAATNNVYSLTITMGEATEETPSYDCVDVGGTGPGMIGDIRCAPEASILVECVGNENPELMWVFSEGCLSGCTAGSDRCNN